MNKKTSKAKGPKATKASRGPSTPRKAQDPTPPAATAAGQQTAQLPATISDPLSKLSEKLEAQKAALRERAMELRQDDNIADPYRVLVDLGVRTSGMLSFEAAAARRAARAMYADLDPRNAVERALSAAMVMQFSLGMGASIAARNKEGDEFVTYSEVARKAFEQCGRTGAQLDRRRGALPQQVVVKHVNVERGAQAIVGQVSVTSPERQLAANCNDALSALPGDGPAAAAEIDVEGGPARPARKRRPVGT